MPVPGAVKFYHSGICWTPCLFEKIQPFAPGLLGGQLIYLPTWPNGL